ncbi:MAG: PQQ-dependent sugar dehydrogenase [Dehalococcoidia bacterium]
MPAKTVVFTLTLMVLAALALVPARAPHEVEAAAGTWTGTFYNNLTVNGTVRHTADYGADLDEFFSGSPGGTTTADNWSAKFERADSYANAMYRITVTADDGVRVYDDGVLILDAWVDQGPTTYFVDRQLSGANTIKVELYDVVNAATIIATIQDVNTIPQGWQAEYFDDANLVGTPERTRNDGEAIAFIWNDTAPGSPFPGVIANNTFSVRWTRTMAFQEGVYQFNALSDDGVRVYVDSELILDYWIDQGPTEHSANKQMTAGNHTVVVEYYENAGGAQIFFDFEFRPDLGGFVEDVVVDNLPAFIPTVFEFAPDGRIFIAYRYDEVKVWDGTTLHNYYTVPDVNDVQDRGLLGMTLDPDFATNGWVYLAYTHEHNENDPNGPKTNKVMRVRANTPSGNVANPATREVLLGTFATTAADPSCDEMSGGERVWPENIDCIPVDHFSHAIGNLRFGPDEMLYVTTGDGASYVTVDSRAVRVQDVTSLAGKILRVNPDTGDGLADNPFWTGDANDNESKVWAMGLRNAFRFNFQPGTNVIFSGDVGWNDWEEINVINAGDNLGWPCYEGPFEQDGYAAFSECQDLYDLGTAELPLHAYEHPPSSAVVGGQFTGVNGYSAAFQNTYFFGDYARDEISVLKVDASNNMIPGSDDVFTSNGAGPVQIEVGPGGDVYYLALDGGEIRRIRFIGDNRPPVAVAGGSPTSGDAPLTVNFTSAGSGDPDGGQAITYDWDFGDGATSTLPNPSHEYTDDGDYTATLTVTDPLNLTDSAIVDISVGNNAPTADIVTPTDGGRYDVGDIIAFSGTGTDPEDGTLSGTGLQWTVLLEHCSEVEFINCHNHLESQPTGSGGQIGADDHGDFTFYTITLTVSDSGGLQDSESISITPNRVDLTLTSNRTGIQITVDGTTQTVPFTRSVPRNSEHTLLAPSPQNPGGGNVYFSAWSGVHGSCTPPIVGCVIITAGATATYNATFVDPTPTATATRTHTATASATRTATVTPSPTRTNTPVPTATNTPVPTATNTSQPTATNTSVPIATATPSPTHTAVATATDTQTPTATATDTAVPTATDTPTATNTAVPTFTPTPTVVEHTPTPTVTSTPAPDTDGDGIGDDVDNCVLVENADQANFDALPHDNGPATASIDTTVANADALGDACDLDDDNDLLPDDAEDPLVCGAFTGLAAGHPSPARGDLTNDDDGDGDPAPEDGFDTGDNGPSWDTDGDGALDGYECAQGTNPRDHTSVPAEPADEDLDDDGDGLLNGWERRGWGTDPALVDTDGDGIGDCQEVLDVDGTGTVNSTGDLLIYAKAMFNFPVKTMLYDLDKNGNVNTTGDFLQMARRIFSFVPCL